MKYKYNSRLLRIISSSLIVGMTSICSPRILSMDLLNQQLSESSAVESINLALLDIAKSLNQINSDCYQNYEVNSEGIVDICYILNRMLKSSSKGTFCLNEMEIKNINTDKITHQDMKISLENIKVKLNDIKYFIQFINNFENVETLFPQLKIAKEAADTLLFLESPHTILLSVTIFYRGFYDALMEAKKCQPNINFIKEKIFSKYVYNYSNYLKTLIREDMLNICRFYGVYSIKSFISMCLCSYQEVCALKDFAQIQMSNDGRLMLERIDFIKNALENVLENVLSDNSPEKILCGESLKSLKDEMKNKSSETLNSLKGLKFWV